MGSVWLAHDQSLDSQCAVKLVDPEKALNEEVRMRFEREAKAAGARVPHPYAAFLGAVAGARYGRTQLRGALLACAEADLALKSSGAGKLVLERLLWTVCPPQEGRAARRTSP